MTATLSLTDIEKLLEPIVERQLKALVEGLKTELADLLEAHKTEIVNGIENLAIKEVQKCCPSFLGLGGSCTSALTGAPKTP